MRLIVVIAVGLILLGCSTKPELKTGTWRGVIDIQGHDLPFNFEVSKDAQGGYDASIINGSEKLLLDEITFDQDSVVFTLHIFDAELKARITEDGLSGFYIKNYEKHYRIPFKATFGQTFRFDSTNTGSVDFTGKYSVTFTSKTDTIQSVGIFNQDKDKVEGTFLNPTGDYRYLQGNVIDGKLFLSTFDGNHAYVFEATKENDSTLVGEYWSGKTGYEKWVAAKNDNAALEDVEKLTFLKEGYSKIDFSFPDLNGKKVSPSDEAFKNKVLILQLSGTWCPNCMDETKFLTSWYDENKDRGVEIIGLAYERKDDFTYASGRVKKMTEKLGVNYSFVIAGTNDKDKAGETLPMLNRVVAFPTTIFIGKDGSVKHIHTGFSGPGTGIYYDQFKQRFNEIVNELLSENLSSKN
ncbi:MAG TPA: TlpA disulfide reductase family protein [Chryseolinea sp.]|nr:TlpA disulfide reductase family protein [Chryseolinea sp.]HPH47268.1 TlpA disulfide reductase family protein [Chryseolinea sp.]HPM31187.1 TlpA disulfide reductase family protein [Chryseolinea sp.]